MSRGIARYIRAHHLALLALFVALGGTSLAATNLINGRSIKPHTIPKNRLTNGAIASLHGARGRKGAQGATGPQGPTGRRGATGAQGPSSWDSLNGMTCTTDHGVGHLYDFYGSQGASNAGDAKVFGSGAWQDVPICLAPEDLEPNDTQATATDATTFYTSDIFATIYPATDNDWFKLTNTDLSGHTIRLTTLRDEVSLTPQTFMDVYRETTKVGTRVMSYAVGASDGMHDWYVHVYGAKPDFYDLFFLGATKSTQTTSGLLRGLFGARP
jgi:hypothetical protein